MKKKKRDFSNEKFKNKNKVNITLIFREFILNNKI